MSGSGLGNSIAKRAADLARTAHEGQYRRDEVTPYITHPERVAFRVAGDEIAEAVAWLHDVLEDTFLTVEDLRREGMPAEVIDRVVLLTNKGDIGYEQYLRQIKADPVAKKVKIADMLTNLSDRPTERQIIKYAKGFLVLLS